VSGDLAAHAAAILAAVPDPHGGLPDDVFALVSRLTPLINVDLLIKDDRGRTLLTWRDDDLFGAGWHLPGGIVRYKERMIDRIHACARAELGAGVAVESGPMTVVEIIDGPQLRGHHISLLYRCRLTDAPDARRRAAADRPRRGDWRWHDRAPLDLLPAQARYAPYL
jgi:ADP-ribose pyrophosphatase YjhB (NUDIX family)